MILTSSPYLLWQRHWPVFLAYLILPLFILLLPRGFHGNDDILIIAILRGGHPAPFIGNGLSLTFAFFYTQISGSIPWYGLFLYGLTCASAYAGLRIIQVLSQKTTLVRQLWRIIASCLLLVTLWAFSQHLTFTIVAITACGLGVLVFIIECLNNSLSSKKALLHGVLIALGYQLRPESGMATAMTLGLFGLVFVLWFAWYKRQAYAMPFLIVAISIVFSVAVHNYGSTLFTPEENAYREYNGVRGSIQGFDKYEYLDERNPEGLKAAGWTPEDYSAFMSFINFDENRFTKQKIQNLLPLEMPFSSPPFQRVAVVLLYGGTYGWPLLICAFLSVLLAGGQQKWRCLLGIFLAFLQLLSVAVLLALLVTTDRTPARICLPMLLICALSSWIVAWWVMGSGWLGMVTTPSDVHPLVVQKGRGFGGMQIKMLLRGTVLSLLALGLLVVAGIKYVEHEQAESPGFWQTKGNTLAGNILKYAPEAKEQVIVEFTCVNGFSNGVDPLCSNPMPFRMIYLEWVPPSPFFYDTLKRANIKRGADIFHEACRRDDILFLVERDWYLQLEIYAQSDLQHPAHLQFAYNIHWPNTALCRLVKGPSSLIKMPNCPPGSIFPYGDKRNNPAPPPVK